MKLKLTSLFNEENENYFKIKVENVSNKSYFKKLLAFVQDLQIHLHDMDLEPDRNYKLLIGRHEFLRTKEYVLHLIFEENYLHLILKCDLEKRKDFIKILNKHCEIIKSSITKKEKEELDSI